MKFLYKIWSGYDRFTPREIAVRQEAGGLLRLGWARYIEAVDRGTEIWVYFHGPHAFDNGVYIKGVAHTVDVAAREVLLRIRQSSPSTTEPLTDADTSAEIADVVRAQGRQVFLLPEVLDAAPACNINTSARTCARRNCGGCPTWQNLPLIQGRNLGRPERLPHSLDGFVPAYWVIPGRNFIYQRGDRFRTEVRRTNELFRRFKTGEKRLAFPLALGMREALAEQDLTECDAIVPVPLSPDKEAAAEIHRTSLLAGELARLLGCPVREFLKLASPISKRRLRGDLHYSAAQFEWAYERQLVVDDGVDDLTRVLLVDDVCTEGSTISACTDSLRSRNSKLEIVAVTAGQMTVRAAVEHEEDLVA